MRRASPNVPLIHHTPCPRRSQNRKRSSNKNTLVSFPLGKVKLFSVALICHRKENKIDSTSLWYLNKRKQTSVQSMLSSQLFVIRLVSSYPLASPRQFEFRPAGPSTTAAGRENLVDIEQMLAHGTSSARHAVAPGRMAVLLVMSRNLLRLEVVVALVIGLPCVLGA